MTSAKLTITTSKVIAFLICVIMQFIFKESPLFAGPYFTAGPNWNNFVFEPLHEEDTPNYFGYGGRGSFGYSILDVWDLGLYAHYTPGKLNSASATQEDARLWHMGAETALRLGGAMYLGVRGGPSLYRLNNKTIDTEISGQWTGNMMQGSLGLLLPVSKSAGWQASLDIGQASLKQSDDSSSKTRTLSEISLTLAFVYNIHRTTAVETALFNNWIKNLSN